VPELDPELARWGLIVVSLFGLGLVLGALTWVARRAGDCGLPVATPCNGQRYSLAAAGLFGAFALMALCTNVPAVNEAETALLQPLFRRGPVELQTAVKRVSDLGGFPVTSGLVAAIGLLLLVLGRRPAAGFLLAVMLGELALEGIMKPLCHRARPPLHERVFFDSFPSGHTLAATILVGVLLCLWLPRCRRRWQRTLAWVGALTWPVLIGASRVYLGRHYVSDVLGGMLLGAAWVLLCRGIVAAVARRAARVSEEPMTEAA
jgi:membrane-associated phospholipid phosphatase